MEKTINLTKEEVEVILYALDCTLVECLENDKVSRISVVKKLLDDTNYEKYCDLLLELGYVPPENHET